MLLDGARGGYPNKFVWELIQSTELEQGNISLGGYVSKTHCDMYYPKL